ncbi:precorrin-3B C(17)-methyltransferase [Actinocrinis sp.]|uniref:precorrin-3B C(17)-methyltransferase n=1 Tax=Actinocrinis sp. TaxID=1920516 RepID=UPI002C0EF8B4|nr:precorrin-3B C(17)-methyltransferase [Actinocrinis sp.]HXR72095.1 precorrin-3B C(17)-methyltransferase [Actinocrinis sp.]
MIGLVAVTASGRAASSALAAAWGDEAVRRYAEDGVSAGDALRTAYAECDAVVSFLAVGATVRVLAPALRDKHEDPAVVCVDEARQFAVSVLGGHNGANELAQRVAEVLDCVPVITTASDASGITPLDSFGGDLGFVLENPQRLAAVGAQILSGEPTMVFGAERWPLPALPPNVTPTQNPVEADIVISDELVDMSDTALVYRPASLVIGVGASRGVSAQEVLDTIDAALAAGGLSAGSVLRLASLDLKADEAGLLEAARSRRWPVEFHAAADLAAVEVPNPSPVVAAETGTSSVAEAAARYTGPTRPLADLTVYKIKSPMATAAVARVRPRGRLAVIGLGPGARDLLAPRAVKELRRASVVVGLDQYVEQIRDLLRPGTQIRATALGAEEERARSAVELARTGLAVALIGSGDAGVYAMASPALDHADADDVDVVCVPGITAATAASNVLGAALGHDHCSISLSDLHTPWQAIERRIRAAAEGDFVVSFYNPRSRQRDWQLGKALGILAAHRPGSTPVGWVRNASRPDESWGLTTLDTFDPVVVDMYTVVTVGCSQSRIVGGRFVTPRGYTWAQ